MPTPSYMAALCSRGKPRAPELVLTAIGPAPPASSAQVPCLHPDGSACDPGLAVLLIVFCACVLPPFPPAAAESLSSFHTQISCPVLTPPCHHQPCLEPPALQQQNQTFLWAFKMVLYPTSQILCFESQRPCQGLALGGFNHQPINIKPPPGRFK